MNRRDFAFLFGAAAIVPRAVLAQNTSIRFLIGYLSFPTKSTPLAVRYLEDFLTALRELGYTEGQEKTRVSDVVGKNRFENVPKDTDSCGCQKRRHKPNEK